MTVYEELIDLKYRKGVSTWRLIRRFPKHQKHVSEVALLGIPEKTLRKIVREKRLLDRLLEMKKKFPLRPLRTAPPVSKKSWLTRLSKSFCPWL